MKVDVISRGGSRRGATWVCICRRVPPARGQSAGGRTRPSRGGRRCLLETLVLGFCSSLVLTHTTKYESTVVSRWSLYYYLAENSIVFVMYTQSICSYKNLEVVPKMKNLVFDNTGIIFKLLCFNFLNVCVRLEVETAPSTTPINTIWADHHKLVSQLSILTSWGLKISKHTKYFKARLKHPFYVSWWVHSKSLGNLDDIWNWYTLNKKHVILKMLCISLIQMYNKSFMNVVTQFRFSTTLIKDL